MSDMPSLEDQHPRGTLFLMGLYAALFVLSWLGVYLVYVLRGGVTP